MSTVKRNNIEFIKASAGTGKTFTLTERIVSLLEKYSLSEMMLTTFTREAAADFKRKTREKLLEKGKTKEAQELELAAIGTIDSIAVKFLHRYWYKLGLGADFTELDDEAKEEYVKKSLTEIVSEEDVNFFNEFYQKLDIDKNNEENDIDSNSKDNIWQNDLKGFIEKIQQYNLTDEEIEKSCSFSIQMLDKIFPYSLSSTQINDLTNTFLEYIEEYGAYYEINKPEHKHLNICQALKESLSVNNVSASDANLLKEVIEKAQKSPLTGKEDLSNRGKDAYNTFVCSNILKDEIVKYIERIFSLGKKWQKSFIEYKRQNNLVDFSDMERHFITLLKDEDVKDELREEIKVVMVDEFQDSNAVQIEIYNLLADIAEKNIWVGDPKQSIYRFRGTDTKTTQELADLYTKDNTNNLRMTWRSIAPLVDFSNDIFSRSFANDMVQDDIKLEYNDEKEELKVTTPRHEMTSSVFVWDVQESKDENNKNIDYAHKLACRISKILNNGGTDPELGKDIKPSDIMILCNTNKQTGNIVKALKEFGLPVSSPVPNISDYLEVQLLLSILKLFVKSSDTKAKVEILHLLHDKNMEDLLDSLVNKRELQCKERNTKIDELKANGIKPTEEDKKLPEVTNCKWTEDTKCLEELTLLKNELKGLSVPQAITGIITRLDLLRRVAKWDDGISRRENLIAVVNRAETYDSLCLTKGKGATLEGFLNYLEEQDEIPGTPISTDSIKIMTYHGCKGLESRIVILNELSSDKLADNKLARNFLFKTEKVLTTVPEEENLVHFCPRFLKSQNNNFKDVQLEQIKNLDEFQAYKRETRNDYNKLLYVGVTRAKEKLILLKYTTKFNKEPFAWIKNIDPKTYGEDYKGIDNPNDLLSFMEQFLNQAIDADYSAPASVGKSEEFRVRKLAKHNEEKILKHVSPSEATEADVDLTLLGEPTVETSSGKRITINANKAEMNEIGTCIHNIFAVWNPNGERADEIQKAQNIITVNCLSAAIPDAGQIISAAEFIHGYLTKTFGPGKMLRELPFTMKKEGRVFSGEMDLVWETADGCVLLDYKNFPGTQTQFTDKSNKDHYVGKYKPQLCLYKEALEKAGKQVLATYIYYSVIGDLVKF